MTSEPNYIHGITIVNNRVDQNLEIDLTPDPGQAFKHLILTGKNGSGKTTTLTLLRQNLDNHRIRKDVYSVDGTHKREMSTSHDIAVDARVYPNPHYRFRSQIMSIGARRNPSYHHVNGPTSNLVLQEYSALEQHLVNIRTQIAYANEEGDQNSAKSHKDQLNSYEESLKSLFEDENIRLEFIRDKIRYYIAFGDRQVGFNELPDGFGSALHIWSSLQAFCQNRAEDWGIVLIDEVEAHLHLSLQERLLPFLTASFPRIQFIVATHSPAVIASIDGAIVYDLSSHTAVRSEDLRGLSYGTIMMGHFGISSDIDLKTTAELVELKALHEKESRTADEEDRLRSLARRLAEKSHVLALKIWNELEFGAA